MDWSCLMGWCAMAADAATSIAKDAADVAATAGEAADSATNSQQDPSASPGEHRPGDIAKQVGLWVFLGAQVLAPALMYAYHRRIVKAMGSPSQAYAGKAAPPAPTTADALVGAVQARQRVVLAVLVATVATFALIAGLSFAFRGESSRGLETLSILTSVVLFAALGGPIVLLGVSATKFGKRFWTWFAPFAFVAIAMQLKVSEVYREIGEITDDAKAAQMASDAFVYCALFLGAMIVLTIACAYTWHRVGLARWKKVARWMRAHPVRTIGYLVLGYLALVFVVTVLVFMVMGDDGEPFMDFLGGFLTDLTKGMALAALGVSLCYFSIGNRSQRVVVPMLAVGGFTVASSIGFFGNALAKYHSDHLNWFMTDAGVPAWLDVVILGIAVLLALAFAWSVLGWIGVAYERKIFSDAQFEVYAWMLSIGGIVVFVESTLLKGELFSTFSIGVGVAALLALTTYSMLIRIARPLSTDKRLLLLRVFAKDTRSERLLDEIAHRWRFIGPIMMIGGPDLARSTLDPAEVAHFIRMKFHDDFIADRRALDRKITGMDERPDPDARYRVNEFFCYANIWQEAVERLVPRSDAILLDLRGFTKERGGTAWELGLIARAGAMGRTTFLLDLSTKREDVAAAIGPAVWAAVDERQKVWIETEIDGEGLFRKLAASAMADVAPNVRLKAAIPQGNLAGAA